MSQYDVTKLRKAQLMIAREIKRVCEKHNIKYFLAYGSLLGAIRHNGFIPWDDDMDLGMCRDDYEKFLRVAPSELGNRFFCDTYKTNNEYPFFFTKVRLKGTQYIERRGNHYLKHNEIFVDIFPFYYVSKLRVLRKIEAFLFLFLNHAILSKAGIKVYQGQGFLKRLKFLPSDILGRSFTKKFLQEFREYLYQKNVSTSLLGVCPYVRNECFTLAEDKLRHTVLHTFEGEIFPVPQDYNYILKIMYGDYMKLPKEDERTTHDISYIDFGDVEIE